MGEVIGETESLCPYCLRVLPAVKVAENNNIYMKKTCPEHGSFKVLVWKDADYYKDLRRFEVPGVESKTYRMKVDKGCPYDCGLCPDHKQDTCMVVLEVTNRCNLNCSICFASANEGYDYHPDLETIRGMYETVIECVRSPRCLQISGGEPTIRDDLPEIIAMGKEMGVEHIELNTNGLRLAEDIEYVQKLKDAGTSVLYFGFDGVSDDIYREIVGHDFLDIKVKALENCSKVGLGVVLVPKVIKGFNDHQIGDIIQFAKKWVPTVKGVHFQPLVYFGRYGEEPSPDDHITIPDVLKMVEEQTHGELTIHNFTPTSCTEVHCEARSFSMVDENGLLFPLTSSSGNLMRDIEDVPTKIREGVADLWQIATDIALEQQDKGAIDVSNISIEEEKKTEALPLDCECGTWMELLARASSHYLTVSVMPFQDAWNIDFDRIMKCCIHVVTPEKKLIPFCVFNITSVDGKSLYRHEIGKKFANKIIV